MKKQFPVKRSIFVLAITLLSLAAQRPSFAGSVTWATNPTSGDWNTASISLLGNSELDISGHTTSGVTIGSLSGDGLVVLCANPLTIGSNNQSTLFSGIIQDGGSSGVTGGSLSKAGSGSLALSRANSYTGGTTVSAGVLPVANQNGSATGTGPVNVNGGTLGGEGTIAGATTIGTGSGRGAFLAPALGTINNRRSSSKALSPSTPTRPTPAPSEPRQTKRRPTK
ncbi:MAG: autotransporter-associated beta strand repeat-containing protein [Chthoniobacterales bacterium]